MCLGALGLALLLFSAATAQEPVRGVVIYLKDGRQPTVSRLDESGVELEGKRRGLVLWAEGEHERWQFFAGRWRMPQPAYDDADRLTGLTGKARGAGGEAAGDLALLTQPLEQLRGETLVRGGALRTPYAGARLLQPRVVVRRKAAGKDGTLPAAMAAILRDGKEIARLPLAEGQTTVRWEDVAKLPKDGLAPGAYTLQLQPGFERVDFVVENARRRAEVLSRTDDLAHLLGSHTDPLYAQAAAEHLLARKGPSGKGRCPYLADALQLIEQVPEKSRPRYLRRLHAQLLKRLEDPDAQPAVQAPSADATKLPEIDRARDWIAAGRWGQAEEILQRIGPEAGAREHGLAALYRGVVLAEAGAGKEAEAVAAYRQAIEELRGQSAEDRFRAHNNFGNFLLNRAQDRLHNHAFQIATGTRQPLLSMMENWIEAEGQYRTALSLSRSLPPVQGAAVRVNQARLYVLLADIVRTLDVPTDKGRRFAEEERAIARTVPQLAVQAIRSDNIQTAEPLIAAVAEELQGHLAYREADLTGAQAHGQRALDAYTEAGSLAGAESAHRLLGFGRRRLAANATDAAARNRERQAALRHFQIAHQLAELLRERFPADRSGVSRAGFFARRAYVNEMIVDLLVAEGKHGEALRYAEEAKARSLQDLLTAGGVSGALVEPHDWSDVLRAWPKDVVALEYFLGSERVWLFIVGPNRPVQAFMLSGRDGKPLSPRELVLQVCTFLRETGGQAGQMLQRLNSGRGLDHSWQDTLHDFYKVLLPAPARDGLRGAKTVLVVPHHVLHYFPFAALVTNRDARKLGPMEMAQPRFLLDEPFNLCYAPSLSAWDLLRRRPARPITKAAALGIPDLPGTPPLPGVNKDLQFLKDAFGDRAQTVLRSETVRSAAVRSVLRQPGLVLFAMHGTNTPDRPLDSHLHLFPSGDDDGRLTAARIYDTHVAADLVVMSACYSGLADRTPLPGDDLFGLQRAFLQAGARTVVSGLWDVYDGTGPELMRGFFRRVSAGTAAPAALADSQRAFLKKLRTSNEVEFWLHPYFWAVYTVIGDDRTGRVNGK